ncbi:MAG TPA: anti-anti-sigma factor, partial [Streptomyces sp.]|nr:anti-anti-sigma factor [Streptomyces sp.]
MAEDRSYEIRRWTHGAVLVLEIHGELDILAASTPAGLLNRAEPPPGATRVIADLRRLAFIDCAGFGVLDRLGGLLRERGGDFLLVVTDPFVRRLLCLTGLSRTLPVHSSVRAALAAAASPADRRGLRAG